MRSISISIPNVNTIVFWVLIMALLGCDSPKSNNTNTVQNLQSISLAEAAMTGNVVATKYHIKNKAFLDEKDPFAGATPLITAATFGEIEVAQLLINAGADVHVQDNEGSTALHNAAFFCREEIVQILLQAGADITIRNNYKSTPLESIEVPFEEVESIYKFLGQQLSPMGLELDLERIKETRPVIVNLLKEVR